MYDQSCRDFATKGFQRSPRLNVRRWGLFQVKDVLSGNDKDIHGSRVGTRVQVRGLPRNAVSALSSTVYRYAAAVLLVAAALLASRAAISFLTIEPFVSLFLCAIMISAWLGGFGPGLLSTVLAVLVFDYYLVPPVDSFAILPSEIPRLALFFAIAFFVNWAGAKQRQATQSLKLSRNGLLVAIEEQRIVEARLLRSEMYLAEAQRLSQTGSFCWRVGTNELNWSDETFRIFGYSRSISPTLDLVVQRVHPEDRPSVQQTIDCASSDAMEFDHEYRLLMPDGTVKYLHALAHSIQDASGNIEFVGAVTDVTAAKIAEEELRKSEQRFRDFAETASDWFWETDEHHGLTSLSRETTVVVGAIGAVPWDLATDRREERERWSQHLAKLNSREPFRDFRFRSTRGDGSAAYLSVSGKPIFGPAGGFLGYRGVASDVTAAVRAEQVEVALHDAKADLARAARVIALGELTTSIAHEVNQPLTAILSNAEACSRWLDRGADYIEAARRSVHWIVRDVNRATEVIRRVRALASKTETERTLFDINDIVSEVRALLRRELSVNEVFLKLELSPDVLTVRADRIELQQVILNLVMNGIEAMQSISGRPREIVIRTQRIEANIALLMVEDCGVGFSAEDADRLFEAFFTTKSKGLGLGLSICRSIIESHDGRLSVSRNPDRGSTFQFTLPLEKMTTKISNVGH